VVFAAQPAADLLPCVVAQVAEGAGGHSGTEVLVRAMDGIPGTYKTEEHEYRG